MELPKLDGELIEQLFAIAEKVAPLISEDAGTAVVNVGRAVVELIDKAHILVDSPDRLQLEVKRDELDALIRQVNAHAEATLGKLKGD